mmetsp:Transcript_140912/g.248935  ORF Transcript_140912/g.248935 Transcript_140912/m.248935 type:complete len:203 (+) Transcript_140912:253-861(+)
MKMDIDGTFVRPGGLIIKGDCILNKEDSSVGSLVRCSGLPKKGLSLPSPSFINSNDSLASPFVAESCPGTKTGSSGRASASLYSVSAINASASSVFDLAAAFASLFFGVEPVEPRFRDSFPWLPRMLECLPLELLLYFGLESSAVSWVVRRLLEGDDGTGGNTGAAGAALASSSKAVDVWPSAACANALGVASELDLRRGSA